MTVAFLVAAALSFLKLGEIALRPHQRKWLQDRFEIATLRLDDAYANYSELISALPRVRALVIFAIGCSGILVSSAIITTNANHSGLVIISLGLLGVSMLLVGASAQWNHASKILVDWRWGPKTLKLGAVSSALVALATGAGIFGLDFAMCAYKVSWVLWLLLVLPRYRRNFMTFQAFPGVLLVAALAFPALWFAKPMVRLALAILWRFIEYKDGAWMAILFAATAVLGIIAAIFNVPTHQ